MENQTVNAIDTILEKARKLILALNIRHISAFYSFCEEEAQHFVEITGREVFDESLRRQLHSDIGGLYKKVLDATIEHARSLIKSGTIRSADEMVTHTEALVPLLEPFAPGRDVRADLMIGSRQNGLYEDIEAL